MHVMDWMSMGMIQKERFVNPSRSQGMHDTLSEVGDDCGVGRMKLPGLLR